MTIYKAVNLFHDFCWSNGKKPVVSTEQFFLDFSLYLKKKHVKSSKVVLMLNAAIAKNYIHVNHQSKTYENYLSCGPAFEEYLRSREATHSKFLHTVVTGIFTPIGVILGGVIGYFI